MENQNMATLGHGGCEFMRLFLPMIVSKYKDISVTPVIEILLVNYRKRYLKKEDAASKADRDLHSAKQESAKHDDVVEKINSIFSVLKSCHYYLLPQNFPEWQQEWKKSDYH